MMLSDRWEMHYTCLQVFTWSGVLLIYEINVRIFHLVKNEYKTFSILVQYIIL